MSSPEHRVDDAQVAGLGHYTRFVHLLNIAGNGVISVHNEDFPALLVGGCPVCMAGPVGMMYQEADKARCRGCGTIFVRRLSDPAPQPIRIVRHRASSIRDA